MTRHLITAALLTLLALPASANPITAGTWAPLPPASNSGSTFFDNLSWDCETCNLAFLYPGVEYLSPSPFTFASAPAWADLGGISDYLGSHTWGWDPVSGAIWLDSGHGYRPSSDVAGQVALLRMAIPNGWRFWAGFEDLSPVWTDNDYNDRILRWDEVTAPPPGTIPEPGLLILFGMGLVAGARRIRRRNS